MASLLIIQNRKEWLPNEKSLLTFSNKGTFRHLHLVRYNNVHQHRLGLT